MIPKAAAPPAQAFELEKELSKEGREARALAVRFRDQTAGWVAAARLADAVMRDFGDHDLFLQAIQEDMREVASLLQQLCEVVFPQPPAVLRTVQVTNNKPSCMLQARIAKQAAAKEAL